MGMEQEGFLPEHANLIDDVVPSARSLQFFSQQPVKFFPHLDDTTSHGLDIPFPLLEQLGVVQDQSDQSRAMSWGVTDLASSEDGKLAADFVRDFGRRRDDVKGTDTFTVQTGVLGETLADQQWDTAFDKFPDGPGITVQITAGETLIGTIEEGVVTLLQNHVCDLTPLFPGRVYTGRVVSAGVKEDDGTFRSGCESTEELVAGEADSLGIVVLVGEGFDSDVPEDSEVVYYKKQRIRHIQCFVGRLMTYPTWGREDRLVWPR